jgi:hypothetical protein
MKTYARFTGFLWIVFCFGIVLLAGVIEEGPKWMVKVNSVIEQKEVADGESAQIRGDSRDTATSIHNDVWYNGWFYTP